MTEPIAHRTTATARRLHAGRAALLALLLAALCLMAGRPALAQETDAGALPPVPVAGATPVSNDDINAVARQLWCPLCSGVRLDACELKACAQMKDEIGIMLSNGEDVQQIKDTFTTRYGPQVLGEPPRSGFNWLAWILPFVALIGGGIFLYMRARTMVQPPPPLEAGPPRPQSDYDRKLDDELNQYD